MSSDKDGVSKITIELLDCQCEMVLKCLEYYCYSANFLFNRHKKYTTRDDELKIALITDTYHQISNQISNSKSNGKILKIKKFEKIS